MLQIRQFRYRTDNLGYLVYGRKEALAVDGGAVDAILAFVENRRLRLRAVTSTHGHGDHTCGNAALLSRTDAALLDGAALAASGGLDLEGERIHVLPTPGHTRDSVVFYAPPWLMTGDTLFNGTVGNCFSGDPRAFFSSLRRLMALPAETVVYAGHDYVREAMRVALAAEPQNPNVAAYLDGYDHAHVRSTLAAELAVNP